MSTAHNPCEKPQARSGPAWLFFWLDRMAIPYEIVAQGGGLPARADCEGGELAFAKTVVLQAGLKHVMVVMPADHRVDVQQVSAALGIAQVKPVSPERLATLFPDSQSGAVPPFGAHYQMRMVVSAAMAMNDFITFKAGSHEWAVRMRFADYERLVQPRLVQISNKSSGGLERPAHRGSAGRFSVVNEGVDAECVAA